MTTNTETRSLDDVVCDLVDEIHFGGPTILTSETIPLRSTPTTIVARWKATILLETDGLLPDERLPGTTIPTSLFRDESTVSLSWSSEAACKALSELDAFDWIDENEDVAKGIAWDDPTLPADVIDRAMAKFDPTAEVETLIEWFGERDKIDYGAFPKRLQPVIRTWVDGYQPPKKRRVKRIRNLTRSTRLAPRLGEAWRPQEDHRMKTSLNLVQLATELLRQRDAKQDYIASPPALAVTPDAKHLTLNNGTIHKFGIRDGAHAQLAVHLEIPKSHYDRMLAEAPELLATTANRWLSGAKNRLMVRVMDGSVRALLSDRYQRIDNDDVAEIALPILAGQPDMHIVSAAITESRMYIKAVFPHIQGEVKKGDIFRSGVVISNSETGNGTVSVSPLNYRLIGLNGMILPDAHFGGFQIGGAAGEGESVYEMPPDETKRTDDEAILLKVRDVVRDAVSNCASQSYFDGVIERMRESTTRMIMGDVVKAIETLSVKVGLNESERAGVLRHLITGADVSKYGLIQAVTLTSQDVEDYDRATELEALGGWLLSLPPTEWQQIAEAA